MSKHVLRMLIVLVGLAGFGMAARAQTIDQIEVKVPCEFVVGSKVLPAGTYKVRRINESFERALSLTNTENGATAFILVTSVDSRHYDNAAVSFEQVGDKFFLNRIQTMGHVFTIPVSHSAILEAQTTSQPGRKPA